MQKILMIMLVIYIPYCVALTPGRSNVAARITDIGQEFGYGMTLSSSQMLLVNVHGQFNHSTGSLNSSSAVQELPDTTRYAIHVYPELRFYSRPDRKISPFFGVFAHLGYGGRTFDMLSNTDAGVYDTRLSVGGGFSTGAEVFLSSYLSFAVSARWLEYTYEHAVRETDTGSGLLTQTNDSHDVQLVLNPAIYLRLHF